jgi:hypothetical protein
MQLVSKNSVNAALTLTLTVYGLKDPFSKNPKYVLEGLAKYF